MQSRGLIVIAATVVLTLLITLAVGLDRPSGLRWVVGVAAAGGWMAFVVAAQRARNLHQTRVNAQIHVLDELRGFSSNELAGARRELERTKGLVKDAVARLGASFAELGRRSGEQNAALLRLLEDEAHVAPCDDRGAAAITACGAAIEASVADAVRLLQFEDISTQALDAGIAHLDRLSVINIESLALQRLLHRPHDDRDVQRSLREISERVDRMRSEWERPPPKPVQQQSMDAGSVELF